MNLISVIVPVYNVENYLRKCLDSIINQTYKDLEIIVVDDGSTDSSGKICDEYAEHDSRIKVIHKPNGGLSDARNAGLSVCVGEYISFVDSDDYIEKNMYEIMIRSAIKEDSDMVVCRQFLVINDRVYPAYKGKNIVYNYEDKTDMIRCMLNTSGLVSVCFKLYKRKIFSVAHFVKGKNYEDAFFITDSVKNAGKMTVIPTCLYYYRMRNDSITHKKQWSKHIWDPIESYKYNLKIVKQFYPEVVKDVEKRLYWSFRVCIAYAGNAADYRKHIEEIDKVRKEFRGYLNQIFNNPMMTKKNKIDSVLAMYLPVRIYGMLSNIFRK